MTISLYILEIILIAAPYRLHALSCHLNELDICVATLFFSQKEGFAETENELNRQCSFIQETQQCLKNYTQLCMTSVQRDLLDFVGEGTDLLVKEYCSNGTDIRRRYLEKSSCLNEATKNLSLCLNDLQVGLDTIGVATFDKRVPTTCCTYQRYLECVGKTVEDQCGEEAVKFLQELLRIAVCHLPDVICTGYGPQNKECVKLLPPSGTEPKGSRTKSVLSRLFYYFKYD
ncbi:uncharacterized protein LOC106464231 isoform X2 [Limulus polyphemus]|uniref:Uncharacterized protein LOC106464231 isoform X2 n=1 Tax=Limulus polyphemus TaxID=6850 RepID=A0ABM1SVI7_LIMPO|nr:uncharacterized protein LOC106464231 isoform X2 [Limulus polyphemus]